MIFTLPTLTQRAVGAGFVGAVATGAAIASMTAPPPPRRRYPAPRPGYIYVVSSAGQAPRAVSAEETSFIIKRIMVASFQRASGGEIFFEVEVCSAVYRVPSDLTCLP